MHDVLVQNFTSSIPLFSMCGCKLEAEGCKQLRETIKIHTLYLVTVYISDSMFQTTFALSKRNLNVLSDKNKCSGSSVLKLLLKYQPHNE
jgi:hypothetical protein